ncbi:lysylphosphatidylglycerol synthetase family protein [cyanobiont of Ornithocercus magnificus]|nr:lysylphosphatidylglycerol synthetase family protein [cyanobiont of Ornithocercus magnificus]
MVLWKHASQLGKFPLTEIAWWWIALGTSLSWLSLVINALAWCQLLRWLGYQFTVNNLVRLYLRSNLLKYLPGGIWHLVDRLKALQPHAGFGTALASTLLEPLLMIAAAALWVPLGGWQSGLALVGVIPSLALIAPIREPLLHYLQCSYISQSRGLKFNQCIDLAINIPYCSRVGYPWQPLLSEFIFVACRFSGFWCCVQAFTIEANLPTGKWLVAFVIAWTAGLVIPGAPGGLGVFETALLILLEDQVPKSFVLVVALGYRLVVVFADLLAAISASTKHVSLSLP